MRRVGCPEQQLRRQNPDKTDRLDPLYLSPPAFRTGKGFPVLRLSQWPEKEAPKGIPFLASSIKRRCLVGSDGDRLEWDVVVEAAIVGR